MNVNISQEELKKMLEKAYEAGWSGCLDLKSSFADSCMEKICVSKLNENSNFDVSSYYLSEAYNVVDESFNVVDESLTISIDATAYDSQQQHFVF